MPDFATTLRDAIAAAPVIDPHSHLRAWRPEAGTIADLVLYHHVWVELVSAGMPANATSHAGLPSGMGFLQCGQFTGAASASVVLDPFAGACRTGSSPTGT